jgi:MFS-type transporter involved in bile tolerance (Atg22 family)
MWGIGLLLEVAIRLGVIEALSVDTANGVNTVITLVVIGLLVLATVIIGHRNEPTRAQPRLGPDV